MGKTLRQEIIEYYTLRRFDGGINNLFSNEQVLPHQAVDIIDWDLDERGKIKVRKGYTKLNANIMSGFGRAGYQPVRGGTRFYHSNGATWTYAACSGRIRRGNNLSAQLKATFTVDADFEFESYKDTVFIYNGTDEPKKHLPADGLSAISAWQPCGAGVGVRIVKEWQDLLWVVPNTSAYVLRHPSAAGVIDGYATDDYLVVGRKDGGKIIALEVFQGNMIIMKDTGIYVMAGTSPDNYQVDLMSKNGCIARRSAVVGDAGIIYLSHDGVRIFDGIQSVLMNKNDTYSVDIIGALNANRKRYVAATYFDNKYIMSYDDSAAAENANNRCFVYNFVTGSWTKSRIGANCFVQTKGTTDTPALYFGHPVSGYVFKMFDGTNDNGVAISATYKTKDLDLSNERRDMAAVVKRFRNIVMQGELTTGNLEVLARVDGGNQATAIFKIFPEGASSLWDTAIWDISNWSTENDKFSMQRNSPARFQGKTISFEINSKTLNQEAEVHSIAIGYRSMRVKG